MLDKEKALKKKRKTKCQTLPRASERRGTGSSSGFSPEAHERRALVGPGFPRGDTGWCLGTSIDVRTGRAADIEWVGGQG